MAAEMDSEADSLSDSGLLLSDSRGTAHGFCRPSSAASACILACLAAALMLLLSRHSAAPDSTIPQRLTVVLEQQGNEDWQSSTTTTTDLQGADGGLPRCVGSPHVAQQLKGELLRAICSHLGESKGLLVFGTGYDSKFWIDSNAGGITRFIEDRPEWVKYQSDAVKALTTMVNYSLAENMSLEQLQNADLLEEFIVGQLPQDIREANWDVVLVDGPGDNDDEGPGRGESIYAAAKIVRGSGFVYVDDCEREVEEAYVQQYFVDSGWTKAVHDIDGNGGKACVMFKKQAQE
jgi:hypothetical protein